jgi:hypothetical protein
MSYFSDLDLVRQEMADQPNDPVGQALSSAFNRVDDLIILANREDTRALVLAERVALGQLLNRVRLLASFVDTATAPQLKVVRRA